VSESPAAHSLHLNLDTIVQSAAQLQSAGFCVEKDTLNSPNPTNELPLTNSRYMRTSHMLFFYHYSVPSLGAVGGAGEEEQKPSDDRAC